MVGRLFISNRYGNFFYSKSLDPFAGVFMLEENISFKFKFPLTAYFVIYILCKWLPAILKFHCLGPNKGIPHPCICHATDPFVVGYSYYTSRCFIAIASILLLRSKTALLMKRYHGRAPQLEIKPILFPFIVLKFTLCELV